LSTMGSHNRISETNFTKSNKYQFIHDFSSRKIHSTCSQTGDSIKSDKQN
jgi:hypothetical protein